MPAETKQYPGALLGLAAQWGILKSTDGSYSSEATDC